MILKNNGTVGKAAARSFTGSGPNGLSGGYANLKALVVSDSTKRIGENAFVRNYSLKYVKLPDSMWNGTARGRINYQAFGYAFVLENINLPKGVTIDGRVFKETPTLEFYEGADLIYQYSSSDKENSAYAYSKAVGDRVIMTYADQQKATLARATVLAQAKADTLSFNPDSDTADTVKNLITEEFSSKNTSITADWNDTFTVNGGKVTGTLTLTLEGLKSSVNFERNADAALSNIEIIGCELTPEFAPETYNYNVKVPFELTFVNVDATTYYCSEIVSITGGQNLEVGDNNKIVIETRSYTGKPITYTITVKRASDALAEKTAVE